MSLFRSIVAVLLFLPLNATAHEFWIDVHDYTVEVGDKITADIRVGQEFAGGAFSFIPANFNRFDVTLAGANTKVRSRIGNQPAMDQAIEGQGLAVIAHETKDQRLTYTDAELFQNFVLHKDLTGTLEDHAKRGLPEVGFIEFYRRFAKSLVAVGHGDGSDRAVGFRTEIVAQANPYSDTFDGNMSMLLLFENEPRANAQIEIFERGPDQAVNIFMVRTNLNGIAEFPTKPGFVYLADAVKMLPLEASDITKEPVWHSLWASLTFAVPQN